MERSCGVSPTRADEWSETPLEIRGVQGIDYQLEGRDLPRKWAFGVGEGWDEVWSRGGRPVTLPRIGWQTPMYRSTVKVTVSQTAVLLHVLPSDMTWPR